MRHMEAVQLCAELKIWASCLPVLSRGLPMLSLCVCSWVLAYEHDVLPEGLKKGTSAAVRLQQLDHQ